MDLIFKDRDLTIRLYDKPQNQSIGCPLVKYPMDIFTGYGVSNPILHL